jgi:hypothetical protein
VDIRVSFSTDAGGLADCEDDNPRFCTGWLGEEDREVEVIDVVSARVDDVDSSDWETSVGDWLPDGLGKVSWVVG